MRILTEFHDQKMARLFSAFLRKEGINNTCEVSLDRSKEQVTCVLWVHDEDDIPTAKQYLSEYEKNPQDTKFAQTVALKGFSSIKNPNLSVPKQKALHWMTYGFLFLCAFIYFFNLMQTAVLAGKDDTPNLVVVTPIQKALMYDTPVTLIRMQQVFEEHPIKRTADLSSLPPEVQNKIEQAQQKPAFRGFYMDILSYFSDKVPKLPSGPMFVEIKNGELWRLFTPCILHAGLLHILFNMLWLVFLGKQLEERIGRLRLLIMIVIVGILSNTAQYLMSGPNFLGFSGVVMGMAGFIWVRKKVAPWEGYPLHPSTLIFLAFFIVAMLVLQVITIFFQLSGSSEFAFNIANTAHISGAAVGALLAKIPFFRWSG